MKRVTRPSRTTLKMCDQTIHTLATQEVAAITTAIHIPKETWELLRAVAFRRAQRTGGRASVSKLIVELVERCRSDLHKELSIDDSSIDKSSIKR
jgi:hypothetical protein